MLERDEDPVHIGGVDVVGAVAGTVAVAPAGLAEAEGWLLLPQAVSSNDAPARAATSRRAKPPIAHTSYRNDARERLPLRPVRDDLATGGGRRAGPGPG